MKLVIDRSRWLRGEGSEKSFLLRSTDGKMCCLGFFGLACGLDTEKLTDIDDPGEGMTEEQWSRIVPEAKELFEHENKHYTLSGTCMSLMQKNDSEKLSAFEREESITNLFTKIGVEVVFID